MTRSAADDPVVEPGVNLLLVDDQPANLLALEAILGDLGLALVKAPSGAEALRHLLRQDFAVILLDVQMGGMDGFETARLIRSRERSAHTPIIFLTAHEGAGFSAVEAYTLGAVDYLVKPLVPVILRAKVSGFVELFRRAEQIQRQGERLRELERSEFERRALAERARLAAMRAELSAALAAGEGMDSGLQRCADVLVRHLDAALARIWSLEPGETVLQLRASAGLSRHTGGPHARIPLGALHIGRIAQEGQPLLTDAFSEESDISDPEWARREGLSLAGYPLLVEGRAVGVVALFARRRGGVTPPVLPAHVLQELGSVADAIAQYVERKHAEEALRLSRERLDLVIGGAGLGLWYCDLPFDKLVWNERCKEHFGLPPDAEVTMAIFYERLHPDDRERTRQAIDRALAEHAVYDVDYRTVAPDGRQRWIRAIGRAFYDGQGRPASFDGITVDVTAQKQAEESLREADRRKDEFLAMLAHELRNPLAPLVTGLDILERAGSDRAAQTPAVAMMGRQLRHLTRLVDDLLDVARVMRGRVPLRLTRLDLARLVQTAVEDWRGHLEGLGLTVTLETAGPVWHTGDAVRLTQVLNNLLDNAARFTEPGGTVSVRLVLEEGGQHAVLSVRDTGVGIEADLLPQLFDVFTQADCSLDRTRGGLGLGLAVVKGLVELHGGDVEASSPGPGRGSEFLVRLPVEGDPGTDPGPAPEAEPASRRARVLIIEDNPDAANTLQLLLQILQHEVRVEYTGPEGLEAALTWKPDVVLSDIGLPGLDGYEIARRLRQQPGRERVLLVALTGYGGDAERRRGLEAGFDYYLVKPADPAEIQRVLRLHAS